METPLEELEEFFSSSSSSSSSSSGEGGPVVRAAGGTTRDFAVVTDASRRFVLGVATKGDLEEFVKRRPA